MALATERVEKLTKYLLEDESRKALLDLSVDEALAKINADGIDFTAEELKEFAEDMQKVAAKSANGELDEASLEDVSGGVWWIPIAAAAAYGSCLAGGYIFGKDFASNHGW